MLVRGCGAALLLLVLSACGAGPSEDADGSAAASTPSVGSSRSAPAPAADERRSKRPEPESGAVIEVAGSAFGPMLFDRTGQAIYLFDVETTPRPRCYGACAEAWPPVLTRGDPVAGRGVDGSLLGTSRRRDGTVQVTYGGHPLYFYAHEGKREVKCHDVFLNGGTWYVVQPDGDAAPPG